MSLRLRSSLTAAPLCKPVAITGVSVLAGALVGIGWGLDAIQAYEQLGSEVAALQEKFGSAVKPVQTQAGPISAQGGQAEPGLAQDAAAWPWLQQRLQDHGLVLKSLRPAPAEQVAGGPVQNVVLEVQGRWSDWLAFERQLDRHAPWWMVRQWQVSPEGADGALRMQWHLRWGWRPEGPTQEPQTAWPVWAAAPHASGMPLFDAPMRMVPGQTAQGQGADPSATNGEGMAAWQLQGTWRQAGIAHAVLALGADQVVVRAGQTVGREGHRVLRVGDGEVLLQAPRSNTPHVHLALKGVAK